MFFNTGQCMVLIESFFKKYNNNHNVILIKLDSNSPSWVIKRYTHQRNNNFIPQHIKFYDYSYKFETPHTSDLYIFNSECQLRLVN